ncbi:aminoglycoside 6'-N-acetyltransferase [Emticicia sp. SJ17W-69]|uniref:aminoglycoside 6'-N-acetyltransferase n=1 Tax=Emticicia sp. SJ17W-69 TaxID=3421657 RepID=UPI003EBE319D
MESNRTNVIYAEITKDDFDSWLNMAKLLWQDSEIDELKEELNTILYSTTEKAFIAKNSNHEPIGFANISIRVDYVEGAEKSPTGYLEGIFVNKRYRRQGIAQGLLKIGEAWLRQNNCTQIGSDTWLTNIESQKFHTSIGFREEERLVHFLKNI